MEELQTELLGAVCGTSSTESTGTTATQILSIMEVENPKS